MIPIDTYLMLELTRQRGAELQADADSDRAARRLGRNRRGEHRGGLRGGPWRRMWPRGAQAGPPAPRAGGQSASTQPAGMPLLRWP